MQKLAETIASLTVREAAELARELREYRLSMSLAVISRPDRIAAKAEPSEPPAPTA